MADRFAAVNALLLSGTAERGLRPLTDTIPNCFVPLGGRLLVDYWIDSLAKAGITEARINTHSYAETVRTYIAKVKTAGRLSLVESYEPALLGSAGTVAANADLADGDGDIVIVSADNLSDIDLRPLIAFHRDHGDPITVVLIRASTGAVAASPSWTVGAGLLNLLRKPRFPKAIWPTQVTTSSRPRRTVRLPQWVHST